MKPALFSICAALLLGTVGQLIGRPLDVIDLVIILFAGSIITWTVEQYRHHRQI